MDEFTTISNYTTIYYVKSHYYMITFDNLYNALISTILAWQNAFVCTDSVKIKFVDLVLLLNYKEQCKYYIATIFFTSKSSYVKKTYFLKSTKWFQTSFFLIYTITRWAVTFRIMFQMKLERLMYFQDQKSDHDNLLSNPLCLFGQTEWKFPVLTKKLDFGRL